MTTAAAPVAETAASAPAPVVEAVESGDDSPGLIDLLDALPEKGETLAKTSEKPEPEAKSSPKAGDADAKPDDQKQIEAATDESLYTDEALASPEGVTRAAEVLKVGADALRKRNRALDRFDLRLGRRAEKDRSETAAERQKLEAEFAPIKALVPVAEKFTADLRILSPRSGASARDRLAALGRMVGQDGQEFYEELSLGIATDGKTPEPSRSEKAMQAQLAALQAQLQRRDEGETERQAAARVEAAQANVAGEMAKIEALAKTEAYPTISTRIAAGKLNSGEVAAYVKNLMVKAHQSGKPIDKATAIGIVEARLEAAVGGPPAERAAPAAESGNSSLPGKPSKLGKTVLPSSADRSTGNVVTPRTQEERRRLNARDPAVMDALFGDSWRQQPEAE
jgi:hypothetical protein